MPAADSKPIRAALIAQANATGGWAYYPGRSSRLEPTCWALLALGTTAGFDPEPHWRFLNSCLRPSGWFVENTALPINVAFNALLAVTTLGHDRFKSAPALPRLLEVLVAQTGLQVAQSTNFRQDNSLRGWSWTDGTFSWVEPTALALIALKRARRHNLLPNAAPARIEEAERMLIDRCCRDGGWNYGNANALGKELFPYVACTAVALLALQDRRDSDAVTRSLRFLQDQWSTEESAISLGLTSICLRQFAIATDKVDQALGARLPVAQSLSNLHAIATALYAIGSAANDAFAI